MTRNYHYSIYPENSPKQFKAICALIEGTYPDAKKRELAVDVDGSTIQLYSVDEKEIVVFDDYDVGAVFIESDVDLTKVISKITIEAA